MDPQLSAEWEATGSQGHPQLVHRAVARWAAATPDAPAISCADGALGYRDLDARANRLAHRLRALGAGRDVVCGIHLDRGLDHYVALLAVLKAGGAALPLDPTYPAGRLRYMLDDSRARVLLTSGSVRATIEGDGPYALVRVDEDEQLAAYPVSPPPDDAQPEDLAYVMYTSASTGAPKGVLLEHGGIANLCRWHVTALGLTAGDCGSLAAPLSFDASILDLWPMLTVGARTVAVADEVRTDLPALAGFLTENGVTVCFLTTALAEIFLAQPGLDTLPLRYLVTGGEALRRRPRPGLPFQLVNIYGPTETTVYATSIVVADSGRGEGPIPIGYPIGGVGVDLLDRDGRPVADGEPGELVVSGAGVGRGYLGKPELTAARFRPVPGGSQRDRRYHTGDLARWSPDGTLEFLGRLDRQVKVRGHRIEPEELERVLLGHPGVRQAAVTVVGPSSATAQLVAYVEADRGWDPETVHAADPPPARTGDGDAGTLARIRALAPGSLLEIGAGVSGADRACRFHVRVDSCAELAGRPPALFDAVLIDCFSVGAPSLDLLLAEIDKAVELTSDGGTVVVAGVPSLPALSAVHGATELATAADDTTVRELRWRVHGRLLAEPELAVHPNVFPGITRRIGRIGEVEVVPRHERAHAIRYDVLLRVGPPRPVGEVDWLDWTGDRLDLAAVRKLLRAGDRPVVAVRGIPHGFVPAPILTGKDDSVTTQELRQSPANGTSAAPTPVDLLALAVGVPYKALLSWAAVRPDGSMDAAWVRTDPDGLGADRIPWPGPGGREAAEAGDLTATGPLGQARNAALVTELRTVLAGRFVAHEMPDVVIVLDRLPLTPVGKVDRNGLPHPSWLSAAASEGPQTPAEKAVCEIVTELLGRGGVGRRDDLVALGAHSLTLAQLGARLTDRFGVRLSVRQLLADPTAAAIAALLEPAVRPEQDELGGDQAVQPERAEEEVSVP